jgi:deoxyribodipyrimidine photo-lyase
MSCNPMQEYPPVPKQASWELKRKPEAVDWDALIKDVCERGAEVPEVEWCKPGEAAALEVTHPFPTSTLVLL